MRRIFVNSFLLIILVLFPYQIKAANCLDSQISEIQKLSANVAYSYTYNEINNNVTFDITFTNLNGKLLIKDTSNGKIYSSNKDVTVKGLKPNKEYRYEVYSKGFVCISDSLRTIYVKTPSYNKYYKSELCKDIQEYKYCRKWINLNITDAEFKKKVNEYLLEKNRQEKEAVAEKQGLARLVEIITNSYKRYYYIILPLIIVVCGIIIYRDDKKNELK